MIMTTPIKQRIRDIPQYLKTLIDQGDVRRSIRLGGTREIPTGRAFFMNTFIPRTLLDWNALTPDIRSSSSLISFKKNYRAKYGINPPLELGQILPRKNEILLNSLRAGHSLLNRDRHRHNYANNPARCACGNISETPTIISLNVIFTRSIAKTYSRK